MMLLMCGYSSALFNHWKLYPKGWNSTLYNAVQNPLFLLALSCLVLRHSDEVRASVNKIVVNGKTALRKDDELQIDPQSTKEPVGWRDIGLRLGRSGYFSHQIVLFWYYATLRKPMEWWSGEAVSCSRI